MAGHSKWANIKHRKGKSDAKKGKIFSRVAKEIISAVKLGGSDPKGNPRLRLAIQKARAASVPNDIIDRNIKKASSADQADYLEMTYELYGYGGVGIMVEILTDNKNRTISDMRIATNKRGGSIANPGSVAFNFDQKGIIQISKNHGVEDEVFAASLNAGAEDFEKEEDMYIVTTDPTDLFTVRDSIQEVGFKCDEASLERVPKVTVECNEEDQKSNLALIEWLENIDDVDSVYHNMEIR
jgi:YebC/PmpR family DNA-binding regulatory protein